MDIIAVLLKHKAAVDLKDKEGYTPLLREAEDGCGDAIRMLLEAGASPIVTNQRGQTALHLAVHSGYVDAVAALIDAKLDVNAVDSDGLTPLHMACRMGRHGGAEGVAKYQAIAELLLSCGADLQAKDKGGKTNRDFVKVLIDNYRGPDNAAELNALRNFEDFLSSYGANAKPVKYVAWNPQKGEVVERATGPGENEASLSLSLYTFVYPKDHEAVAARHFKDYQKLVTKTGHALTVRNASLNIWASLDVVVTYFNQTGRINIVVDPDILKERTQNMSISMNGPAADLIFVICLLSDLTPEFQKPAAGVPGQLILREMEAEAKKK